MPDPYLDRSGYFVAPKHVLRWFSLAVVLFIGTGTAADAIKLPEDARTEAIHSAAWTFSWEGETEAGPVAVHGFYWRADHPDLAVVAVAARDKVRGTEETGRQAERLAGAGRTPLAAVNADFFVVRGPAYGSVHGPFVRGGELLSMGDSPAAVILEDGSLAIEKLDIEVWLETAEGERIEIDRLNHARAENERVLYTSHWDERTATDSEGTEILFRADGPLHPGREITVEVRGEPQEGRGDLRFGAGELVLSAAGEARAALGTLRPGTKLKLKSRLDPPLPVAHAVGGLPVMIREGELLDFTGADPSDYIPGPGDPNARHPRTAIGTDGDTIVALAVDGRAPGISEGMTIPELAAFMRELGCVDALNLDGGGSTTAWARGRVLNRPSDGAERPLGNALVLVHRAGER